MLETFLGTMILLLRHLNASQRDLLFHYLSLRLSLKDENFPPSILIILKTEYLASICICYLTTLSLFSIHSIVYSFELRSSFAHSNSSLRESISLGSDELIWISSSITPLTTFELWNTRFSFKFSNLPSNSTILASREKIVILSENEAF